MVVGKKRSPSASGRSAAGEHLVVSRQAGSLGTAALARPQTEAHSHGSTLPQSRESPSLLFLER